MADDDLMPQGTAGPDQVLPGQTYDVPRKGGLSGLLSSPKGKAVVIGCSLALLLVAAASIGMIVLVVFGAMKNGAQSSAKVVTKPPAIAKPASPSQQATGSATGRPIDETTEPEAEDTSTISVVTNSDVFALRDPFDPLIKPIEETSTAGSDEASGGAGGGSGGSGEQSETVSVGEDTLVLQDIVAEDGRDKAVLQYEATVYTLAEGERVSDTPWEVLSIGSNSVVMLYGDSQVTLTPGQGMERTGGSGQTLRNGSGNQK